jgi:hypothetical protein
LVVGYFKKNRTQAVLLLPLFIACLWVFPFMDLQPYSGKHLMPLYELLVNALGDKPFLFSLAGLGLAIAGAFLLNHIAVEKEVLNTASYMPGLLYGVFMSCGPLLTTLHPLLCSNIFVMLALNRLFATHRKESAFAEVFDAGFCVSIATLFYVPSFVFLPLIWISLILIRPFIWREWVISTLGFVVPYLFVGMYFYWIDKFNYLWYDKVFYPINLHPIDLHWPVQDYLLFGLMAFITLVSFTRVFSGVAINTVRAKNNLMVLVWMCGLSLASVMVAPEFSIQYLSFLAVPCSVFAANFFISLKKNWFAELLFSLLLLAIVLAQFLKIRGETAP